MKNTWKKYACMLALALTVSTPALASSSAPLDRSGTGINTGSATPASSTGNSAGMTSYTTGGTSANVGISANDRTTLTNYVRELPSGVRSTNSSASQYRVGETLPASVQTSSLPANVTNSITSTPSGYSYVQAGSDVYLISNANRRIVDRVGIR